MKIVKQVVAVLAWCVVSGGCVAEEVKQPPIQNDSTVSSNESRITTDIDGEKIPVTYRLAMSKNEPLCSRVAKSLPQLDYNGICDICNGKFDLFDTVKWTASDGSDNPTMPHYAVVDINNDGKLDTVSHLQASTQSHFYYFLVAELGNDSGKGFEKGVLSERTESTRVLRISSVAYPLDGFDEKPKPGTDAYSPSRKNYIVGFKNMMPFRFDDRTYVFMDTWTNIEWEKGWQSWIVISQYIGGEFSGRYKPGVFEDQCYFEIIFNKPYVEPANEGEAQ